MKKQPVYDLSAFGHGNEKGEVYANGLSAHAASHVFTQLPHKHDFYLVVLVTGGSGLHEIDFKTYPVKRGSLFLLQPGQMHYWKFSDDINGFVFFHSRAFYEEAYTGNGLHDLPFYRSLQGSPYLALKGAALTSLEQRMKEIFDQYRKEEPYRLRKLQALVNLAYLEIAGGYETSSETAPAAYLDRLQAFEKLIEQHFRELKSPADYARRLNVSEKHLNRIVRACLNKTSTQLITERAVLEARRLLITSRLNVTQVGDTLGYADKSYFVRVFKKTTRETPMAFLKRYQERG